MKTVFDDVVICLALLLGFSTSLLLAIANQSWGTRFPPSLIAFFAAVSVAALIYRFLGGSGEAQFRMGVLQLTGSAAVLFGATWFLGDRIHSQTTLYDTDTKYRGALAKEQARAASLEDEVAKLTDERDALQDRVSGAVTNRTQFTVDEVRRMKPDHSFVSSIRRMVANEDPPFKQTLRDIAAKVTLNDAILNANVYRICADTQTALFEGLETQKDRLRIRRDLGDSETRHVDIDRGGLIPSDNGVCAGARPRTFDIQITCADAVRLFPDRVKQCNGLKPIYQDGVASIRGEQVMLGALPPR